MTKDDPIFQILLDHSLSTGDYSVGCDHDGAVYVDREYDLVIAVLSAITPSEMIVLKLVLNKALQQGLGLCQSVMYEVTVKDYMEVTKNKFIDDAARALRATVEQLYKNEVKYVLDNRKYRAKLVSSIAMSSKSGDVAVSVTALFTDLINKNKALKEAFSWNLPN